MNERKKGPVVEIRIPFRSRWHFPDSRIIEIKNKSLKLKWTLVSLTGNPSKNNFSSCQPASFLIITDYFYNFGILLASWGNDFWKLILLLKVLLKTHFWTFDHDDPRPVYILVGFIEQQLTHMRLLHTFNKVAVRTFLLAHLTHLAFPIIIVRNQEWLP